MSPADGPGHRSAGRQAPQGTRIGGKPRPTKGHPNASTKMTIASSYDDAREVQRLIRDEVVKAAFDDDSQFAIKLALEEAIINAIKHGNKLDLTKRVQVEWKITPEIAEIIIEDQGPGFNRDSVPNPTEDSNLEKLTGRGILLIETYMDNVEYSKGGRRVRLVRYNRNRGRESA
jgi:serine/threonine-protein kinase RsbW